MKPIQYGDLTIHYDGKACIHARRCVLGLPGVFKADARPWIQPEGTDAEAIMRVIEACPSGALRYERADGREEPAPGTNTVRTWQNGPLEVQGDIHVEGHAPRRRALLCRCGRTSNPPFCDNSHREGFEATGLPGLREDRDAPAEAPGGPLEISARENGSLRLKGAMEIVGADGSRIARRETAVLCRCGHSKGKPFCDGSHSEAGFQKAGTAPKD